MRIVDDAHAFAGLRRRDRKIEPHRRPHAPSIERKGFDRIAVDGDDLRRGAFDADFDDARRIDIGDAHAHIALRWNMRVDTGDTPLTVRICAESAGAACALGRIERQELAVFARSASP